MKKYVNFSQFCDSFSEERKDTFSYYGKQALFDYLEDYEDDIGEEIELDIVALCCEYTEYADLEELQADYPDIENMEQLADRTTVIPFEKRGLDNVITKGFLIAQF